MHDLAITDFIKVYHNSLTAQECDELINEYAEDEYVRSETIGGINAYRRTSTEVSISSLNIQQKNPEIRAKLDATVYTAFTRRLSDYVDDFWTFNCDSDTGYSLLRYNEGCEFKEHFDDANRVYRNRDGTISEDSATKRQISGIILLNDDFEGGELKFYKKMYQPELKKGTCILFPSNMLFPHRVTPVTKGTRYSIVTWFYNT